MSNNNIDCAQAMIKCLADLGVEYIFGYSGGAAIPFFDALETVETPLKFVLTRHEQGATHMADGYARATGKPAVVLVTSGPGVGNTLTGIMTAHMDSVPMIIISGQQVSWMLGKDAFQEADIYGITMPVVKHSYLIRDTESICRVTREAHHIATTGRPGPVLMDVPKDISQAPFDGDFHAEFELQGYQPQKALDVDTDQIIRVASLLRESRQPVILAGHGAMISGAEQELLHLAETLHAPVTTTLLGKGVFPENHPLSLGMLGMHGTAYANKAILECDLVLNVGSRFDDRIIGQADEFCKEASIIHIDIDAAELNKMINVDVGIVGDARAVLRALNSQIAPMRTDDWLQRLNGYKEAHPLTYDRDGGLRMQELLVALNDITEGRNAIISTDVGQHQMWAAQFCRSNQSLKWLSSGGAGTMGFGFPAAIGAQFAFPDELVVAVVGDGGFQMTLFELATAVIHKLPVKILLLNNHYLGMVRQWQEMFYENRESGVDLEGNPDFVKLAEAYGAAGFNISSSNEIQEVFEKAFAINDRPVVINAECVKTENVFPMIPAGSPYEKMILEAPTEALEKPVGST